MNTPIPFIRSFDQGRSANAFFVWTLLISLLLHVTITGMFLLNRSGNSGSSSVSYLDLTMADLPASPPPETVTPPEEQTEPVEETESIPAPTPEPEVPPSEAETLRNKIQQALDSGNAKPEALKQVSLGFGITSGHFSTLSDGQSLRDDMREYYLTMLEQINNKWWLEKNALSGARGAVITVVVARTGTIVDKRMVRSSGNGSDDRVMLHSVEAAGPLPPLPEHYSGDFFVAPIRFVAPLKLMKSGNEG